MKRILSAILVLAMVFTVIPVTLAQVNVTETETSKLIGNDIIGIETTDTNADNLSKLNKKSYDMEPMFDSMEYTEEELSAMSREELVANTKDELHSHESVIDLEKEKTYGTELGLKDPRTSDNAKVRRIMDNKDKAYEKIIDNKTYAKKLADGTAEATKADEKYLVVDNTILITNEDELRGLDGQSGYFRLTCDINLSADWEPIDFFGVLEGNGYTITAANMQFPEYDYVGFFSQLGEEAIVRNLNFSYPYVYANANAGIIAGYNQGTIENCHVENGTVVGFLWADFEQAFWEVSGYNIGGLVGVNEGYIMDCSFDGDIDGWTICGGITGINAGYVFACYALGNVCYELNTWDYDEYGASYMEYYGYSYYPPFTTILRFQWAAFFLCEYEALCYGYNGGIVGQNYFAVFDCCVQGRGSGSNYNVGAIGGMDCDGGIAGGDAGWCSHCYSIDKAFPALSDGAELLYPWDYGDEGYGIYYELACFLVHKGIGYNAGEVTCDEDDIFYYGANPFPCDDDCYHGEELTADQFYDPKTFSTWNHGEWNNGDVWLIEEGYIPIISDYISYPTEYVIVYEVGNYGQGKLDGEDIVYKMAYYDEQSGKYTLPQPPKPTNTGSGVGIEYWTPFEPTAGKPVYEDTTFKAFFGKVKTLMGDVNLDGVVNTADAAYFLKAIADGKVSSFSYQQCINADVTYDGDMNTGDVTLILKYCAGQVSRL